MLDSEFALFLTVLALVGCLVYCVVRKIKFSRALLLLLFVGYIGVVATITLFPLIIKLYPGQGIPNLGYNLIPFNGIFETIHTCSGFQDWRGEIPWITLGGNIVMFMPLGVFLPLIFPSIRRFRRLAVVVSASSCAIEVTQLFLGLTVGSLYRCVDIDDVILNTIGGMLGYGIYWLVTRAIRSAKNTREKETVH